MARAVLSLCLFALGCWACDSSQKSGQEGPGYAIPLAGRPLPGYSPARGSDKTAAKTAARAKLRRLSRDELLEVAQAFYPRLDPAAYPPCELEDRLERSPKYLRLQAVMRTARSARGAQWADVAQAVHEALGRGRRGFFVWDDTHPYRDPRYGVFVAIIGPNPEGKPRKSLFLFASQLVPYYYYYEEHKTDTNFSTHSVVEKTLPLYQISPEFEPVVALLESLMARHYGYFRLDAELAEMPVPGIFVPEHLGDGPPTLRDALFGPPWPW